MIYFPNNIHFGIGGINSTGYACGMNNDQTGFSEGAYVAGCSSP